MKQTEEDRDQDQDQDQDQIGPNAKMTVVRTTSPDVMVTTMTIETE